MSQSLELPDDIYSKLQAAAEASGTTPIEWIAAHLPPASSPEENSEQSPQAHTMADLFAGRIGTVASSGDQRLSEDCGEKFTDYLEEKRKAGHL